ncbi:MAG TPA: hypothetical protein VHK63_04440 [Candidatus Limnocylindria bacterium]|nr:hypothetical protein [Candidatus Limnocylindria bacterium]
MKNGVSVEFELRATAFGQAFRVRLDVRQDRCAASVTCGSTATNGLGATAREALLAALTPFGPRTATALMASPDMFAASAEMLAARAAV